jgi:hypothetical protein
MIDEITAEIVCHVHGTSYLFRREDGQWETQEEKRERLKLVRVCEACENEFQISAPRFGSRDSYHYCPTCSLELGRQCARDRYQKRAKAPRVFRCKCGTRVETLSYNKVRCDECQDAFLAAYMKDYMSGYRGLRTL